MDTQKFESKENKLIKKIDSLSLEDQNTISIDEFNPEMYSCEADGSCSNGHIHIDPI